MYPTKNHLNNFMLLSLSNSFSATTIPGISILFYVLSPQLHRRPAAQVPSCPGAQLPRRPAAQAPCRPGAQLPRCPAGQAPSCPGAQLPSCPAAHAPSCPGAQLPSLFNSVKTSEGCSPEYRIEQSPIDRWPTHTLLIVVVCLVP